MELNELMKHLQDEFEQFKKHHARRVDALEAKLSRPGVNLPSAGGAEDSEHHKAFVRYLRTGDLSELREKAMSIGSDPDGGFTVPKDLAEEIAKVALLFSPMRQLATVRKVSRAAYAQIVSTNAAGGEWLGETDTRNETTTPTFAEVKPTSGGLGAIAPVTRWLLEDST